MILYILLILMIIGAIAAIQMKDLISSVIAVGAVGLGLSIAFLVLKAPDLAITQLVVELLCLIILIRATLRKDLPFSTTGRWFFNTLVTTIFVITFLVLGYISLRELPVFGQPIMKVAKVYLDTGLVKTGATNLVASVILDFRAYDTLGEATILFTAVIGVMAIMRRIGRKKLGEKVEEE
jgi:multicomponent Na+:H+ antiporter subunit B